MKFREIILHLLPRVDEGSGFRRWSEGGAGEGGGMRLTRRSAKAPTMNLWALLGFRVR